MSAKKYRDVDLVAEKKYGHEHLSRKLDGVSSAREGWNSNKLENIQNRIQSVLKQINK